MSYRLSGEAKSCLPVYDASRMQILEPCINDKRKQLCVLYGLVNTHNHGMSSQTHSWDEFPNTLVYIRTSEDLIDKHLDVVFSEMLRGHNDLVQIRLQQITHNIPTSWEMAKSSEQKVYITSKQVGGFSKNNYTAD